MSQGTRSKRKAALTQFEEEYRVNKGKTGETLLVVKQPFGFVKLLFLSRKAKGRLVENVLIFKLVDRGIAYAFEAEDQSTTRLQLSKLAYALAGYRADHRHYPKELSQLVPHYISKVPRDLFSDKAFRYIPQRDSYLLYSVGMNGKDDGGRTSYSEPEGDDIVIDTHPKLEIKKDDKD